jgi:hypothetical protein
MDMRVTRLAVALRWLAGVWLVGWTVYVTIWDSARLGTLEGMTTALAALLIPAAMAWGLSWGLDRLPRADRRGDQSEPQ